MFSVKQNLLYIDGVQVKFVKSPNIGGVINPIFGIIHYDASQTQDGAVKWMTTKHEDPNQNVSAHLSIGRDGKVIQMVPFNIKAWHAGKSEWKGYNGLNSHSIGIELQNTGKQAYTGIQMEALIQVCIALNEAYSLREWIGHSDVSPGRKVDPGPMFDWSIFRAGIAQDQAPCKDIRKTKQDLNLREKGFATAKLITTLPKDTQLQVLSTEGSWSVVYIEKTKQTGWVNNNFLYK